MLRNSDIEVVYHTASIETPLMLLVYAKDYFSRDQLQVEVGQVYRFTVTPGERWRDWWIPTSAKGFNNIIIALRRLSLRVSGAKAKCFTLCGTMDEMDATAFVIGLDKTYSVPATGYIAFFANDVKGYYGNNHGKIALHIERLV